jgi:hypothetical protein
MTYLPTSLQKIFLIIIFNKYLSNLTSQIVKMINQMVFVLLVKKTTLITLDMLKLTYPKQQGVFLAPIQIWFFY